MSLYCGMRTLVTYSSTCSNWILFAFTWLITSWAHCMLVFISVGTYPGSFVRNSSRASLRSKWACLMSQAMWGLLSIPIMPGYNKCLYWTMCTLPTCSLQTCRNWWQLLCVIRFSFWKCSVINLNPANHDYTFQARMHLPKCGWNGYYMFHHSN